MKRSVLAAWLVFMFLSPTYALADYPYSGTLARQLQQALDESRQDAGMRSASAAVVFPDGETWTGVTNKRSARLPVSEDMLFSLASVTKTFISACILRLAEEQLLDLDDSVGSILGSALDGLTDSVNPQIPLRELLNHTSGVDNFSGDPALVLASSLDHDRCWTPLEVLDYIDAPDFPHGTDYNYSNSNYLLLGMVIEAVTGQDVATAVRSRFYPGAEDIFMMVCEDAPLAPFAQGYNYSAFGVYIKIEQYIGSGIALYSISWTSGNIFATAERVATWAKDLYGGDILSTASLDEMQTMVPADIYSGRVYSSSPRYPKRYALGTIRVEGTVDGEDFVLWGHTGSQPGFRAFMFYWPEKDTSFAVLVNQNSYWERRPFDILVELVRVINHQGD